VLLLALAALAVWRLVGQPRQSATPVTQNLRELLGAIEAGAAGAVADARAVARTYWDENRSTVFTMLTSDHPRVRAAACVILADRPHEQWTAVLLPRANDADWRVREAAFVALSAHRPWLGRRPMANTPLDERERRLLAWLDAGETLSPGAGLCEIYADAAHVEFGRPLAARCLTCHAPPAAPQSPADADCAKCHEQIHRQWADGAHAQSLSHLNLRTVDPVTRKPGWMEFGDGRGLRCVSCHRQGQRVAASQPATQCASTFQPIRPTDGVCNRCHEDTARQWRRWRDGRQPRRAVWPPGQLDMNRRGDQGTCITCHAPRPRGADDTPTNHAFSARRNPRLLRDGVHIHATAVRRGDNRIARLLVTNLAGHEYPTGTRRRAMRLDVGPSPSQLQPLATLRRHFPGQSSAEAQPLLAPGEQRSFEVLFPQGAEMLHYRLIYLRNFADPAAYTHEILSGSISANAPPAMR